MTLTREPGSRTRLQFGLLGPLVASIDGREVSLGGRRQRAVVAVLLLARGHQVSTERLLDALWEGSPPPSGPASLQSYVSHLRRALEPDRPARAPSRVLVSSGSGYRIPVPSYGGQRGAVDAVDPVDRVDPVDAVDAWRFERLVGEAARAEDAHGRVGLLREALDLWRGPALADFTGSEWADTEARRLDELRSVAREQLLSARLDSGETAMVVPEAEALLAEEPLREERWRLLALALYRSHRQGDALAALRRARERLADELGVDPGPALRALEAEVLAQSPALDAPAPPARTAATSGRGATQGSGPVPSQRRPPTGPRLVDREGELAELRTALAEVLAGQGRTAVIEGPAGIGKTSLMAVVRDEARAAGATVLGARGSQLEREFGFGAVRQLFDPVLTDPDRRERLFAGAAAGAAPVFDVPHAGSPVPGGTGQAESLFTVLHGLYWVVASLAAHRPLVIAVDDVQWCDTSSLRFLGYLAHRLDGLPVLLVATLRTGEQHAAEELLQELSADPDAVRVQPTPLSAAGSTEVVRSRLGDADAAFASACFRTTSGNPLLLRQLLRALEAEGVRPDASHADTVRAIGSRAVSSLVMMRFRRMPLGHREVARAIAVLGDGASLPLVASMTDLSEPLTATAIAGLARSEVLRPEYPLGFVHPLVEAAVYDDLPLGERDLQHDRAAHVLAAAGASPEQVAAHLLLVPPRGDLGVVATLREAAQRDVERGSTESATAYLHRAMAEPPPRAELPALLLEIGRLEALTSGTAALEHLAQAYRLLEDPRAKAEAAIMLARTAVFAGPRGEATRIARAAAAELPGDLVDQRQSLVALSRICGFMHGLEPEDYLDDQPLEVVGSGPGARGLAALVAWELLCQGVDRERALELARFAVADRVLQRHDPGLLWVVAANVLFMGGEDTSDFWERELDVAHRTGNLFAALATHLWLGFVQWHRGDLRAGLQSLVQGTEQNLAWSLHSIGQMYVEPFSVHLLLDRGHVADAREVLELARDTPRIGDPVRLFLEAESRLLLHEARYDESLALLDRAEPLMSVVRNPVWRPQRWLRARTLHAMGRDEESLDLLAEELDAARRWGTNGLVGRTLLLRGQVEGARGEATVREALRLLEDSERRLDVAWAQLTLADLVAGDRGGEARSLLERALARAETCGADGLRDLVADRLRAVGVDVPAEPARRVWLTPAERRVAQMAADGRLHDEIAMAYLMTTGTVASMVASVQERLHAHTPDQLREALVRME
jgi:DNA-binding SARP family transcriptional activator/tetratricopeptide (TPR) repeat protein